MKWFWRFQLSASILMLSMLFGSVGLGYLIYGKKAGQLIPLGAGLALMIFPYFISSVMLLIVIGLVLMIVPFVLREG